MRCCQASKWAQPAPRRQGLDESVLQEKLALALAAVWEVLLELLLQCVRC